MTPQFICGVHKMGSQNACDTNDKDTTTKIQTIRELNLLGN